VIVNLFLTMMIGIVIIQLSRVGSKSKPMPVHRHYPRSMTRQELHRSVMLRSGKETCRSQEKRRQDDLWLQLDEDELFDQGHRRR